MQAGLASYLCLRILRVESLREQRFGANGPNVNNQAHRPCDVLPTNVARTMDELVLNIEPAGSMEIHDFAWSKGHAYALLLLNSVAAWSITRIGNWRGASGCSKAQSLAENRRRLLAEVIEYAYRIQRCH